jgi:hypothetical protein
VPSARSGRKLVTTAEHANSHGEPAWLTLFRYPGRDFACVWVWAEREGPWPLGVEQVPSLVEGRPGEVGHEACLDELQLRGLLTPDDVVGTEYPRPVPSEPPLVSPFGVVPAMARRTNVLTADSGAFMSDEPVRSPSGSAPGTFSVLGYVADDRAAGVRPIPNARVAVAPATLARDDRLPLHAPALATFTDRNGFFAFVDLPAVPLGYDLRVEARGYPPLVERDFARTWWTGETWLWQLDVGPEFD